jgi:hypothetical protein
VRSMNECPTITSCLSAIAERTIGSIDWISDVAVPIAAIVVSASLAVLLATFERRASRRDRAINALCDLQNLLCLFHIAAQQAEQPEAERRNREINARINAVGSMLRGPDLDVLILIAFVFASGNKMPGWTFTLRGAEFAIDSLEAWLRGDLKTRVFTRAITPDIRATWTVRSDVRDWESYLQLPEVPMNGELRV